MSLLIIVLVWLNLAVPGEVVDSMVLVSSMTLAECEDMRREVAPAWADNQVGLQVWSWCVEAE